MLGLASGTHQGTAFERVLEPRIATADDIPEGITRRYRQLAALARSQDKRPACSSLRVIGPSGAEEECGLVADAQHTGVGNTGVHSRHGGRCGGRKRTCADSRVASTDGGGTYDELEGAATDALCRAAPRDNRDIQLVWAAGRDVVPLI